MRLDDPHLVHVERQHPLAAEGGEFVVGEPGELHGLHPGVDRRFTCERGLELAFDRPLDRVVGQQPAGEYGHVGVAQDADEVVAARRRDADRRETELRGGSFELTGVGVGDPGHRGDLDRAADRRRDGIDRVSVDHRVDEHRRAQLHHLVALDGAIEVVHPIHVAGVEALDADEWGGAHHPGAVGVVGGDHVDA